MRRLITIAESGDALPDEVMINGKCYKHLSRQTKDKLEHIKQLAEIEVVNYQSAIRNYPQDRMRDYGLPGLERLRRTVTIVDTLIARRQS